MDHVAQVHDCVSRGLLVSGERSEAQTTDAHGRDRCAPSSGSRARGSSVPGRVSASPSERRRSATHDVQVPRHLLDLHRTVDLPHLEISTQTQTQGDSAPQLTRQAGPSSTTLPVLAKTLLPLASRTILLAETPCPS